MDGMSKADIRITENVLHTADFIAKKDRPFSDHPDLLNCKNKMGLMLVLVGTHGHIE